MMFETFDPYHAWLGIPPEEQPPDYYRLLGVRPFEEDLEVIAAAADQRVGSLHAYQAAGNIEIARRLLGEVANARACLVSPTRKAAYDKGLRESLRAEAAGPTRCEEAERVRTERFLAVLQERDLLPAELLEGLHRQVAQSQKPVPAEAVARRLIEGGHLTPALAERLLAAGSEALAAPRESSAEKPGRDAGGPALQAADEELQLVPVDDGPGGRVRLPAAKPPSQEKKPAEEPSAAPQEGADGDLQLVPVDDGPGGRVRLPAAKPPSQEKKPAEEPSAAPHHGADGDLQLVPVDDGAGGRVRGASHGLASPPAAKPPGQEGLPPPPQETGKSPVEGAKSGQAGRRAKVRPATVPAATQKVPGALMASAGFDAAAGGPLVVAPKRSLWRRLFFLGRPPTLRSAPGRKTNVWDSPLLLVGGGILLALVLMLIALLYAFFRQAGDEALRLANEDYRNGSYSQAIYKYNQYLKRYSSHQGVSLARVNCGLARLRQATPRGTSDWSAALQVARNVLEEIASETEFKRAQGDVSVIMLTIAQGLAAQARAHPDPALVAQTREALALMKKYVPTSLLRGTEISEVEDSLALTERDIASGDRLAQAIAEMKRQVGQGETQRAYDVRRALLKDYPLLADNEQLTRALMEVSRAEQKAVQLVEKQQPAETSQRGGPLLAEVALARRTLTAQPQTGARAGQVVFALAGGAAYALDASSGKVLWRRFVGLDANGQRPSFPPTPISAEPGGDVLLVGPARNELLRVEAASGRLRWRYAVGERFDAHPLIAGGQVLVATRSGRLLRIAAAEGESSDYLQLPQALRVAPAVDPRRRLIFQVADHSNLFVLGLGDGQCKQVVYLGHELGSITAAPVVVGRFLLIAVNDRARDSALKVLAIEEGEKGPPVRPVQQIRLSGHVDVPPSVDARSGRVLVATDLGAAYLFELSGTDAQRPLRAAAEAAPGGEGRLIYFPLMQDDHIWIAGAELSRYDIDFSRRRLALKWTGDGSSAAQQPLVAMGRTVFYVRRQRGVPGVLVSAWDADQGQPLWETHLAAPLAGPPIVEPTAGAITAVTSVGGVYRMDETALKGQSVLDQPDVALPASRLQRPLGPVVQLEGGLLAVSTAAGSDQIGVLDPQQPQEQFRWLRLPGTLACPPIAFAGGLLAPCTVGQVFLIDPHSGHNQTEPFQPRLEGGVELSWRLPADGGKYGALLADGGTGLYRVEIARQPTPHLEARDHQQLAQPIVSPVAVVGDVAYAVDGSGALAVFKLPDLSRAKPQEQLLPGRCVWGPRRVGEHVMLSTDDDQLLCLGGNGELAWRVQLPYGPLAGTPLAMGDEYTLAAASGVVWRVDARTGKQLGKIETGRPLGTGPVLLGHQLLLGGRDGSLYKIERP